MCIRDRNARISAVVDYASVRNGLLFKALHTPNVEFQLYDVVKKTGELVPAWKFRYRGTSYQCLSRSEKILAGLEVVELLKRLTGRCYPVFIDDSESIDHIPVSYTHLDVYKRQTLLRGVWDGDSLPPRIPRKR